MKKLLLLICCCLMGLASVHAQKFALIDMEYIMEKIPAYQQASNQLNQLSQRYQKEIDAKAKEAENLYKAYQKNAAGLSASQRTQQEEAIIAKEKEMKRYLYFSGVLHRGNFQAMMCGRGTQTKLGSQGN